MAEVPEGPAIPDREPVRRDVVIFPPIIPVTGLLLGVLLEWLAPLGARLAPATRLAMRATGGAIFLVGVAGFAWMVATMRRAQTPVDSARTPTRLVEHGPFRYTRNPMYLFGAIAYLGLTLLFVLPWALAMLPVVLVLTHFGVVVREEEYLEHRFGEAYRHYKQRTRRWI